MKTRAGQKIRLTSVEELLGVTNEESAMDLEIAKIRPFKDHPFKVLDDEKMQDLMESIRINGILSPVLVRPIGNDAYEMVSGHRRMHAAMMLGMETVPAIIREMTDGLILDLVEKGLVTDQMVLTVGYDTSSLTSEYSGPVDTDWYGRKIPKQAHGSKNLGKPSSSTRLIMEKMLELYDEIVDRKLLVRRMYVVANHIVPAASVPKEPAFKQLDLFTDYEQAAQQKEEERAALEKEKKLQQAMLAIKKKHGKNAILHGTSYQEAATGRERNAQIGGHRK